MQNKQDDPNAWLTYGMWRGNQQFTPPTDVIELPEHVLVLIEIAAIRPEHLNVTLQSGKLIVTGIRERPSLHDAAYHRVEIGYGDFRIEVTLPFSVEQEGVTAAYQDGLLRIELPRQPAQQIVVKNQQEGIRDDRRS